MHRDHIIPKCKGGTDEEINIQWLCANCHEDKTREDLTGFNTTPIRKSLSAEHRARLIASRQGRIVTAETRAKQSAALKGKPASRGSGWKHSEDARAKISATQTGKPKLKLRGKSFTEAHRQHLSESLKGKPKSPSHILASQLGRVEAELAKLKMQLPEEQAIK